MELLLADEVHLLAVTKALLDEDSGLDTLTGSFGTGLLGLWCWPRGRCVSERHVQLQHPWVLKEPFLELDF